MLRGGGRRDPRPANEDGRRTGAGAGATGHRVGSGQASLASAGPPRACVGGPAHLLRRSCPTLLAACPRPLPFSSAAGESADTAVSPTSGMAASSAALKTGRHSCCSACAARIGGSPACSCALRWPADGPPAAMLAGPVDAASCRINQAARRRFYAIRSRIFAGSGVAGSLAAAAFCRGTAGRPVVAFSAFSLRRASTSA